MTLNLILLGLEAILYFAVMVALLHYRKALGLGVFICALGVMHFLETYLAAAFYIQVPFGVISPGSAVFFAGKLILILLVYIKEDAATVRQPIYGLLIGNFLIVGLATMLRYQITIGDAASRAQSLTFIDDMGVLMVWGTMLLYIDALGIILLYERLRQGGLRNPFFRILVAGAVMLTFDQAGFFGALHMLYGVGSDVFFGGLYAKMLAAVCYAGMAALYLHFDSGRKGPVAQRELSDIFADLTFRERYETLLASSGRDSLTGALNRSRFDRDAPRQIAMAIRRGQKMSLSIADVDHFKLVNDAHGHLAGDEVLRRFVAMLRQCLPDNCLVYRYGGEEFIILSAGRNRNATFALLEDARARITAELTAPDGAVITFCAGIAELGSDGDNVDDLINAADMRLYAAKQSGRNRVV